MPKFDGSDNGLVASRARSHLTRSKCEWSKIWTSIYNDIGLMTGSVESDWLLFSKLSTFRKRWKYLLLTTGNFILRFDLYKQKYSRLR